MDKKDARQKLQEEEYEFPYHYLPKRFNGTLKSFRYWGWGYNYFFGIEMLVNKLRDIPFETLIDVGCGDGRITGEVQKAFKGKWIKGVDYSSKAIEYAKLFHPEVDFSCWNIMENPPYEKFDVCLLIEVLEHIPDHLEEKFLSQCAKMIVESGTFIITVPHINQKLNPKHYRHYSEKRLKAILSGHFASVEIFYFDKKSILRKIWNKILYNKLFILNNNTLLRLFEKQYRRWLLPAETDNCLRIGAVCRF